ncbi:DUF3987 domain-containing protein [Mesorhizobium marinum]|uniref:DUF3987 domain-containing protein n=1 Tax=Mesorhizobium marinum TaxID=3228790 RepID=A0ABV3R2D7_9HYPH
MNSHTLVNFDTLPKSIADHPCVLWKYETSDGKATKPPYQPTTPPTYASSMSPATWSEFGLCRDFILANPEYGLGLILGGRNDDRLIGFDMDDLDHVAPEHRAISEEWRKYILAAIPSYAELSPSQKGVHLICRGILPNNATAYNALKLKYGIEIYSARRYLTTTGNRLPNSTDDFADCQLAINELVSEIEKATGTVCGGDFDHVGEYESNGRRLDLSDAQVLERACTANRKFQDWAYGTWPPGVWSDVNVQVIGDLDKVTGSPDQILRIVLSLPYVTQSAPAANGEAREHKVWRRIAKELTKARPNNDRLHAEREAERARIRAEKPRLDSIMATTLAYQREINRENVPPVQGASAPKAAYENREPIDYWAPATPAAVPQGVLPGILDEMVQEVGDSTGLDKSALCVLSLSACAMATTDKIRIRPVRSSDRWKERFGMWGIGVGASGAGKSPLINIVGKPIKDIDKEIRDNWTKRCETLRAQAAAEGKKLSNNDLPPCPDLILGDTTTEAAQDAMLSKVDGVGILDEEVTQFFAGIDRYMNGGKGDVSPNRAFWLKSYDGIGDTVRRIGRGKIYIDNIAMSIVGCIQPDPIKKISAGGLDDGMMQRITPVLLTDRGIGTDANIQSVLDRYDALVKRLHTLSGRDVVGGTHQDGALLSFSHEAQGIFIERQRSTKALLEHFAEIYPSLHMHLKKYDGMLARLSLGLHLIDYASLPQLTDAQQHWIPNEIAAGTIRRAEQLLFDFLLNHAMAFHIEILGSGQDEVIRGIAGYILTHNVERVTLRLLQRNVAACREMERRDYQRTLDRLYADGWLVEVEDGPKRVSPPQGIVNEAVHVTFARKAEEERVRRDEIYRLTSGIKYKGRV